MASSISAWDIRVDDETPLLQVRNDEIEIVWKCPRCGHVQETTLTKAIVDGTNIYCANVNVCGDRNVWFEFNWDISGNYSETNDKPLNKRG